MASFDDRDGFIWLDGQLMPWREAKVHVLTHTLHYGMGCFEGVRAYETPKGTAIFRLTAHTQRLFNSAKILGLEIPFTQAQLNDAQRQVVRENKLPACYIRPMVFLGSEGMGLHAEGLAVHVMVAAWSWGSYLGEEQLEKGLRVKTSSFQRHHVNVTLCRAKANGNYLNSMMAINEVSRDGYDEALMLDVEGYVAEGSAENIFTVAGGRLYTPDLTSALDGITRRTVMELAAEMGIACTEKRITRDEVYMADEAFFTGTAAEVVPIRELDNRVIGTGARGPITQKLQSRYLELVRGKRNEHAEWLAYV